MANTSVLHKLRSQLVQYLSYDDIKDHLVSLKLLTYNEYQRLNILQKNATDCDLVEKLLELVMRKGPNHETIFIQALGQSLEQSNCSHLGNQELLPLLQREMDLQQSSRVGLIGVNSQNQGKEAEKDGIYLFPQSPDEEHSGFLSTSNGQSMPLGRSEPDEQNQHPALSVGSSVKWKAAADIAVQDAFSFHGTYPGLHSAGSPVFRPRAVGNMSPIDNTQATRLPLFQSSPTTRVTESFNSMSLHSSAARGNLHARAAMTLGDFSMAQEVRRIHQDPEELKCQMVKESKAIMRKYATLVLQVYRLLQKPSVCFEEVRLALITLGCSPSKPGSDPSSSPLFSESSEIVKAKSIPELVTSLHSYSSWFNYDLIKFLGEQFGGEEGVELIAAYEVELRKFFKKFVFECPQFASLSVPEGFAEMEMKVDWEYRNCTTQDVAIFKTTVTELLGIKPHALRLKSVEEGCVLLTWMVSSSLLPHIALCLSKESVLEKLAKERMQSVTFAGKFFDVPTLPHLPENESPTRQNTQKSLLSCVHSYSDLKRRNSFDFYDDNHTALVTPTVSSLSDMTEGSSPFHHSSVVSIGGSYTSKRALCSHFSDASVDEFFAETHSVQEAEILSLYSGERSPTSTIDRYSKRNSKRSSRDSSLIQESHLSLNQPQSFTTGEFALSDSNLHHIASRLSCSIPENRRKSETDITRLKNMCQGERIEKKKPKPSKYRFSLQRIVNFRKRRSLKKSSQTPHSCSPMAISTSTNLLSQLSSPTSSNQFLSLPQCLPLLELSAEPLPASKGKPHYYNFLSDLSQVATDQLVTEPLVVDLNENEQTRGDGTSVASLKWQPSMSDLTVHSCNSQEMAGSQERTLIPLPTPNFTTNADCQGELGMTHSQPCPSSSSRPWKSFPHSPSSEEIHSNSTQLRIQGHTTIESNCSNYHQRSKSASTYNTYRMQQMASSDECSQMLSRVASPSCSINSYPISSGYCSRRSSEYSLSQTDSVTINQLYVSEEPDKDCYSGRLLSIEGKQRPRSWSVRGHNSLSHRSRNVVNHAYDTSPLARSRSNSMHK